MYKITVDDQGDAYVESIEVDAPDLPTAILRAGMQLALNRNPLGPVHFVKAEVPGGWQEVKMR